MSAPRTEVVHDELADGDLDDGKGCWWVDFCRDECPAAECHQAGCCAFPPRDIVDVPIAGDVL